MNALAAEEILHKIHNLPSLPTVVLDLLASMGQEEVNVGVLANKISQDQALTAKTLRLANSSFYGMAKQVTTIQEAITILGFRTVRSLATTAALITAFTGKSANGFNAMPFWRHSIAAAVCARALASHLPVNPDYAYTAGLLHDIGRLVLVTQFQSHYEATMAYRAQHDCALLAAEQAILGLDHAQVGQVATQHWKFPEELQQALVQHHNPRMENPAILTMVVIAADTIAHALDLSMSEDDLVPSVPDGFWPRLGLDEDTLLSVFKQTEKQFKVVSSVLTP
jgi:putative nucleotidyltransferase with HDIG domain